MEDKIREEIALLRYSIIAPLISETNFEGESLNGFFLRMSEKKYKRHDGTFVTVSASTIQRWYYNYKKGGLPAITPKRRVDIGGSRKLDDDLKEQIKYFRKEFPRIPATLIYQKLLESGAIRKEDISLSTVSRYIRHLKDVDKHTTNKDMRRYELENVNDVWYADTTQAFSIEVNGKKKKTYIICFLDDKSRFAVGIDVFFNDNRINVIQVMKSAVSKFGKPKVFSFDNGSSYKNKQVELVVARLGSSLNFTAPYSPQSKGKCERFFNTLKQQWLSQLKPQDFKSIEDMSASLKQYAHKYNLSAHSSLMKKSPQEVFFNNPEVIRYIEEEDISKIFLLETDRTVTADAVVRIDGVDYQVHYRYAKRRIKLRYSADMEHVYVVDGLTEELEKIEILRKVDNSKAQRETFQF